ncbi:DUF883 family protein [Janthinobacterium fluminis]|uniref:DUF883 family protein n=1 Tax=Janthinobacterium fluminis TaxID=2987524 RepID=A0ABT5JYC5_9BURK|nr:DUF883 family protein [Janthinobacterium fluminis]MDC8757440.1 DUF883 family protein [Janthinobacterium fluminis]
MDSPEPGIHTQERLIGDLRLVIENAEELLKNTGQYSGILYQNARAKLTLALQAASEELARFEDKQLSRMIAATRATNDLYPHLNGEERLLQAFRARPD